jgi:hypothetical protein
MTQLSYTFGSAATIALKDAQNRLGAPTCDQSMLDLLSLGAALSKYIADDGSLYMVKPHTFETVAMHVLGKDWESQLGGGLDEGKNLTVYAGNSLLKATLAVSANLDLHHPREAIPAMAAMALNALDFMDNEQHVNVWNPATGACKKLGIKRLTGQTLPAISP